MRHQTPSTFARLVLLPVAMLIAGQTAAAPLALDLDLPLIQSTSQGSLGGDSQIEFTAADGAFRLETYGPAVVVFTAGARPVSITDPATGPTIELSVLLDANGDFVGGVAGPDFRVTGTVRRPDGNIVSGVLLSGEAIAFGFQDSGTDGANGRGNDDFDVRITGAEGLLADLWGGNDIGVDIFAEQSSFRGTFTTDFDVDTPKPSIGVVPPLLATLGDRVWLDANGDGVQNCVDGGASGSPDGIVGNAGDAGPECGNGVSNVEVQLFENPTGDACGNGNETFAGSEFTNGEGFYLFEDLVPGDYCVTFVPSTLPAGFVFTSQDVSDGSPDADTVDSDADPTTGRTANISLGSGETDLTIDAGIYEPAAVGDQVWLDVNRDGLQDDVPGTEPGVAGVRVSLFRCEAGAPIGSAIGTQTTGSDGLYLFDGLAPGNYAVIFDPTSLPANFEFTTRNAGDDALDSDADPVTGSTDCGITLESGDRDLRWDAGIRAIPNAGLGNFVWNDLNADGVQDDGEPGIPGVFVELLTPGPDGICDTNDEIVRRDTVTGPDGLYAFTDLVPGRYCVRFARPDICALGESYSQTRFTVQADAIPAFDGDSDANPASGQTTDIDLPADTFDPRWDAGFYCASGLGDQVFVDVDRDGIQDDVPGTEPGLSGVTVSLQDCSGAAVVDADGLQVAPIVTDASGLYSFGNLRPGQYRVAFGEAAGYSRTLRDVNDGLPDPDARDSDADGGTGLSQCVTLPADTFDPTIDAGYVENLVCDLSVQKTCRVIPVVTEVLSCDDVKPIDEITMRWSESGRTIAQIDVYADAYDPGKPDEALIQTIAGPIVAGDVVTASGYVAADAPNDVDWLITFTDGTQAISRFHRSCSDGDMDGIDDCGTPQGNAKNNDAVAFGGVPVANTWAFEGLAGGGRALSCTPPAVAPGTESSCSFSTLAPPHCQGKVQAVTLRYDGGDCSISNAQEGRAECLVNGSAGEPVRIVVSDGGGSVYLDTVSASVGVGDVVRATASNAGDEKFGSNTVVEIFSATGSLVQSFQFHTSCSKPLNLGDAFGAVTVVGLDTDEQSASLGVDVRFDYRVTNQAGFSCATGTVVDDLFGTLESNLTLGRGESVEFTRRAFVTPDDTDLRTDSVFATCELADGTICEAVAETVIERIPPPVLPTAVSCSDIKPIGEVSLVWNGTETIDIATEGGELFRDVAPGNLVTFDTLGVGNDVLLTLSTGQAAVHVSCSDSNMNGVEDCGTLQGNSKSDDPAFVNQFLFAGMAGMAGLDGAIVCPDVSNTGTVAPEAGGGPVGSTGSATASPFLEVQDDKIKWELTNTGTVDLFIEGITVLWPTEHVRLEKMKYDGDFATHVHDADGETVLDVADFEGDSDKRRLKAGEHRRLEIEFTGDYKENSAADYTIEVTLSNGQVLSFPVDGRLEHVEIGTFTIEDHRVKLPLENTGSVPLVIETLTVTWPTEHGALKKAKLDGDFAKDVFDTGGMTVLGLADFEADIGNRTIKVGDNRTLEIEFTEDFKDNVPGDYTIVIEFEGGLTISQP